MDFQDICKTGKEFVCPNDRQLALRAKLKSGWSGFKSTEPLKPEEQAAIISVIKRNEDIENAERLRVGRLVDRVEKIKHAVVERGPNCCRLCGDAFGILRPQRIACENCQKIVCAKCSVDINIRYHTIEKTKEIWLCRVCSEVREMWKKTGAWFFKGLPNYDIAETSSLRTAHTRIGGTSSEVIKQDVDRKICGGNGDCLHKNFNIRVNDSSSSEEDLCTDNYKKNNMSSLGNTSASETFVSTPPSTDLTLPCIIRRGDSLRMRTFGSLRSFIDVSERKLSNSIFFHRQHSKPDCIQQDLDSITTRPTVNTSRPEDNQELCESVSSSWSISESSSCTMPSQPHIGSQCRDPLLGWLEVAVNYFEGYHSLDCTIVRARDLSPMDAVCLTDPFCMLNVINPMGNTKFRRWKLTRTVHKTRNPDFNETIKFVGVEPEELNNSLLYVALFDDDKYGHDFLGSAKIGLSKVHNKNHFRVSVPLSGEDQYSSAASSCQDWPHGKILISLCYDTRKRALVVHIKKCIDLTPMDSNGTSDPFVKM